MRALLAKIFLRDEVGATAIEYAIIAGWHQHCDRRGCQGIGTSVSAQFNCRQFGIPSEALPQQTDSSRSPPSPFNARSIAMRAYIRQPPALRGVDQDARPRSASAAPAGHLPIAFTM